MALNSLSNDSGEDTPVFDEDLSRFQRKVPRRAVRFSQLPDDASVSTSRTRRLSIRRSLTMDDVFGDDDRSEDGSGRVSSNNSSSLKVPSLHWGDASIVDPFNNHVEEKQQADQVDKKQADQEEKQKTDQEKSG